MKTCPVCKISHKNKIKTCSDECSMAFALSHLDKNKARRAKAESKEWRKKRKEQLEAIKTIRTHRRELQVLVNKIVRTIDAKLPCISCAQFRSHYDAGHYHDTTNINTAYNFHNNHKQCVHCNRDKHGNLIKYRKGLIARYGVEYAEFVDDLVDTIPLFPQTADNYRELKSICRDILKQLKSGATFTRYELNEKLM